MYTFVLPKVYILGLKGNKEGAGVKKLCMRVLDHVLHLVPNRKLPDNCVFTSPTEPQQASEPYSRSIVP